MKTGALATIILSELLILLLTSLDINASNVSFVSTLVVVVVVAFSLSALLQKTQSLTTSKKYTISGVGGVLVGLLYYWWADDNFENIVTLVYKYGVAVLLIFILIPVIYLFKSIKQ